MFKSIFTRYLAATAAIIFVSFILLGLILTAVLSDNSMETRDTLVQKTADSVAINLSTYFALTDHCDIREIIETYGETVSRSLESHSRIASASIAVYTSDGGFLIGTSNMATGDLPASVTADVLALKTVYGISDLEGLLPVKSINYFYMIKGSDGETEGIILVTSPTITDFRFVSKVIKLFVAVSLWIFLAVLIGLYIVSERVVAPLRQVIHAAHQYALGDFSERIPVVGQDEVATLSDAFNNMADSLSKTEENRNTFIANVSHDLRTPMTTISGFVDGILDGTIPPERQQHYLEIISSETRRLSRLVSSLLELTKAGSLEVHPTRFNLTEKARQALIGFESKIDAKHLIIDFNCEEDVFVNADSDAIHQVVYNLCDNAVKFTPEGGRISLTIGEDGKKGYFEIRNTGDGIPAEELPLLFDRFYKSDRSRGLDKTGTGLGLYIVKSNLTAHGEGIHVDSEVGKYTCFSFELPLASQRG